MKTLWIDNNHIFSRISTDQMLSTYYALRRQEEMKNDEKVWTRKRSKHAFLKKRIRFCEISYDLPIRQGILWSLGEGFKNGLEKYMSGISYYLHLVFEDGGSLPVLFRSLSIESHSSWMIVIPLRVGFLAV